jgi:Nitroreductase family
MPGVLDTEPAALTFPAWDRMMVRSTAGVRTATGAGSAGLAEALALIDAGRAVPSAGALHPCECYVVTADGAYYADAARRICHRLPVPGNTPQLLDLAGLATPPTNGALIVIATRPWLSMRKYGDRGYLYTQLDTAHLATSLLGLATDRGTPADLRLRLHRTPLAKLLTIQDECREIHSVLRIAPTRQVRSPSWSIQEGGGPERPSWLERVCWQSLEPLLTDDTPQAPLQHRTLLPPGTELPVTRPADLAGRWPKLATDRRSSKGFRPEPIPGQALGHALSALGTALTTDLPVTGALQLTLVTRSVTDLAPGIYRLGDAAAARVTDEDVVTACARQDHLRHAAVGVLWHVHRDDLLGHPPSVMRDMLFQAGALSHLLYLGAADAGIGVTGVGGFDAGYWRRLRCVPDQHELLYLVLLGADDRAGVKWDRLPTAYQQR